MSLLFFEGDSEVSPTADDPVDQFPGDEEDEADEEDDDEEYIRAKGQELATAGLIGPNGRCTKKCKFMIRSSFMAVKEAFRDGSGDDDDDEDEWRRIGTPRSQQGRIRARHMLDCSHF